MNSIEFHSFWSHEHILLQAWLECKKLCDRLKRMTVWYGHWYLTYTCTYTDATEWYRGWSVAIWDLTWESKVHNKLESMSWLHIPHMCKTAIRFTCQVSLKHVDPWQKWRWGFYPKLCGKMSRWSAWQPLGGNCWMWVDRVTWRQTYANITCNQSTMKLGGGLVLFHLAWLRDLPKWSRPVWRLTCQAWITTCAIAIHLISRSCKRLSCSVEIWVRWRNCLMNIFWIRQIIQKTSSDLWAERSAVMLMVRLTLAISIAFSCRWLSWGHDTAIWVRLTWAPLLFPRSPKSLSPWWCTWLEGLALPTHTTRSELQTEFR